MEDNAMKKEIDSNRLPKQEYIKPTMDVVKILQSQMLCGSPGAKSLNNSDDFHWSDPFDDEDDV